MSNNKTINDNKKILLKALAKTVKKLRGDLSQSEIALKGDISSSIINMIEHARKDPQYTTLYKLAETFEMDFAEFTRLIQTEIPTNLTLIDK